MHSTGNSQDSSSLPLGRLEWPRTVNYSKSDYKADIQNWSISQGTDGMMFFANNEGLLSFDGTEWELFPHPDNLIIRSVASGKRNRIYAGTYEDFGYWEKDEFGTLNYHSLRGLVEDFTFHNQEIWKIQVIGDSVLFQSFTVMFLYYNEKIQTIRSPGIITCLSVIGDKIYLRIADMGLYHLNDGELVLLDDSAFFKEKMIRVILPYGDDQLLIATSIDGLYLYSDKGNIKTWNLEETRIMDGEVINRGIISQEGQYVFGTQLNGIYLFDQDGRYQFNISQENGLQNNTVLGLYLDKEGLVWTGLDNGIDMIDLSSRVSFYKDLQGKIGAVYSVLIHEDILYAGTNKGLFYSYITKNEHHGITDLDFNLIPESEGQVWSLEKIDNQILCGHNNGSFGIHENEFRMISDVSGGYSIKQFTRKNEKYLIQCTYTDLVVYKWVKNAWYFSHRLEGYSQPTEYLELDHLGNIWNGHKIKGLYRVTLDQESVRISDIKSYGSLNGLSSDFKVGVYKINNRVVFLNEGRFFTYEDLQDTIIPHQFLNQFISEEGEIHRIVPSAGNEYWFISDRNMSLYSIDRDECILIVSYPFNLFSGRQIKDYENLRRLDSLHSILCLDNGFALISHKKPSMVYSFTQPLLKKVRASRGLKTMDLNLDQSPGNPTPELPYNLNSLSFHFAWPNFRTNIQFRIMLEGLDEDWIWLSDPEYRYDRLPAGDYTFHLQAIDDQGNITPDLMYGFSVLSPWYWSIVSKIVYLFLFVLLILLIRRYFIKRLILQEVSLKAEKESEIIRIRNEQLNSEISFKSKELANTTFNIIKKNELLLEIRKSIDKEKSYGEIARLVDRNISNEEDWKVFESNFERAHQEFLFRIKKEYDLLTPSDLKLCAYLRMNLSTKKIALLLGITTRGVENHRYRLRKKLQLAHELNLTEFLMKF